MKYVLSPHAQQQMLNRGILAQEVDGVLQHPQQIVSGEGGRRIYPSRITRSSGKTFLLRVVAVDSVTPVIVVSIYVTTKIAKYWSQPMKVTYDPLVDALCIRWSEARIEESDEQEPGVIMDFDENGQPVGLEVLDASKRIQNLPLQQTEAQRPSEFEASILAKLTLMQTQMQAIEDRLRVHNTTWL